MIPLTAEEAGRALGLDGFSVEVPRISIDSRAIVRGDLFVAIRGERFDGHDFVRAALREGAAGAVVERSWWERAETSDGYDDRLAARVFPVPDTLEALGGLARAVRRKSGAKVIGVTGSVGKTGTKDLIARMAEELGPVVKTAANQNNEIGVPLTLLSLREDTTVAVVEMGMRGTGQIAALAAIAEPDVGVVTNVHPVHLETLGSLEAIAAAKSELLAGLRPTGRGVVPVDCALLDPHARELGDRVVRFALEEGRGCAEVWGEHVRVPRCGEAVLTLHWPGGEAVVRTPFASRARLQNALAAAAACWAAGLNMERCLAGLERAVFTRSRGDVEHLGDWSVIDDTYNASPAAVRASLDELMHLASERGGRPVAVLGDMLELGPDSLAYHQGVGEYAAEVGVEVLWGVGPLSRATAEAYLVSAPERAGGHVERVDEWVPVLASLMPGDVVLFKASRSLKLEVMVEAVRSAAGCEGSTSGRASGQSGALGSGGASGSSGAPGSGGTAEGRLP